MCHKHTVHVGQLWMHSLRVMNIHRQQKDKEYGKRAENGFSVCPLFFHTAYTSTYLNLFLSLCLYYASPLKIGSRLPCPQKAEIFLTQRPTSIGTCYEIRWFGWFLHSMFILSIPIWEPLKGWVDSKCSYLRSWLQTNLGGSWRCCERGMLLFIENDCFFKIAVLCLVFAFLSQSLCVCVCSLGNFDSSEAFGILPRAVHSSNREVPWFTKLKTGHTEKMCNPELRTPKKEPLVIICWDITLCSIRKILVSLAPKFQPKPHSPQKDL